MTILQKILSLLLYTIAPVKRSRFVFMSFNGHYSDSPKYICEAMHKLLPDAECIWITDARYSGDIPPWAKWIEIGTLRAAWAKGSAKAIIDNVYCERGYTVSRSKHFSSLKGKFFCITKNKKQQRAYTTWHGVPLKRMGRDQQGNDVIDFLCAPLTIVLNNKYCADIIKHLTFERARVLCLGTPRNDLLFYPELKESVKKKLGLPTDKKVLLFAPTFRNDGKDTDRKNVFRSGINQLKQMNFSTLFETLSCKFDGDWVMICRFHYHVADLIDWVELNERYPGRFINGNAYDDMSEYLLCTDILLTDASSCMFDFSITKNPVFLFFPDYDYYAAQERGLYIPLGELPFPFSKTFAGLIDNIRNFNEDIFKNNITKMFECFQDVDDGHASDRIAEFILDECSLP